MFKSYLRAALRSLIRDRHYAFINMLGLAVAMASCLVLGVYLKNELTYDQHNVRHENIYRVVNLINTNGFIEDFAQIAALVGPIMKRDHPQILDTVNFQSLSTTLFRHGDVALYQDSVSFADPNVFDVFTHEVIAGDPASALEDPNSIAISETFAGIYFGEENPIGQSLMTDTTTYQVSLVFADLPPNTHFRYEALLSMNRLNPVGLSELGSQRAQDVLSNTNTFTYVVMPDDYRPEDFAEISNMFWDRYRAPQVPSTSRTDYYLEPLADIHLHSTTVGDRQQGSAEFVYAIAAVGIFLLLIAAINYVNLATARAARREKEIAVRKVIGAEKGQLITQFLGESVLLTLLSVPLAMLLAEFLMAATPLASLLGTTLESRSVMTPDTLLILVSGALAIGLLAGMYPAAVLANMQSAKTSRLSRRALSSIFSARHALVLIQFLISIAVITCTLLMYLQTEYLINKPLGFDKENKLVLRLRSAELRERLPAIKEQLLQLPGVLGFTTSNGMPGGGVSVIAGDVEGNNGEMAERVLNGYRVGVDYLNVMNMEVVAGRDFDAAIATDETSSMLVNETAVTAMGWENPLGKNVFGATVVGVVKDFHFHNLSRELEPLFLAFDPAGVRSPYVTLDLSENTMTETIAHVEEVWRRFAPDHPFEYQFLEENLNQLYATEQRNMSLLAIFAAVCIFISCLGLAGLTAFTTQARAKELSIRRILGATSVRLLLMLFKSIFVIVVCAALLASLASLIVMSRWLQSFAFHIDMSYPPFLAATSFCVLIAFVTMSIQSWRMSRVNPVDALRQE